MPSDVPAGTLRNRRLGSSVLGLRHPSGCRCMSGLPVLRIEFNTGHVWKYQLIAAAFPGEAVQLRPSEPSCNNPCGAKHSIDMAGATTPDADAMRKSAPISNAQFAVFARWRIRPATRPCEEPASVEPLRRRNGAVDNRPHGAATIGIGTHHNVVITCGLRLALRHHARLLGLVDW